MRLLKERKQGGILSGIVPVKKPVDSNEGVRLRSEIGVATGDVQPHFLAARVKRRRDLDGQRSALALPILAYKE